MTEHNFASIAERLSQVHSGYTCAQRSPSAAPLPNAEEVRHVISLARQILFPGYFSSGVRPLNEQMLHLWQSLRQLIANVQDAQADEAALGFVASLPDIAQALVDDVEAAFNGDPATEDRQEIIHAYPGFFAIVVHRLAHRLLQLKVPLLPRIMAEAAHAQTGIDIHPGAQIGPGLFIDHGTGVVIGETCVIGANVKLYQGVTLGALSFARDAEGELVRHEKRHPTIEDRVVIYANATILGGQTVIGHDSVIGSSVWLNQSVAPMTMVTLERPLLRYRGQKGSGQKVSDVQANWFADFQI